MAMVLRQHRDVRLFAIEKNAPDVLPVASETDRRTVSEEAHEHVLRYRVGEPGGV